LKSYTQTLINNTYQNTRCWQANWRVAGVPIILKPSYKFFVMVSRLFRLNCYRSCTTLRHSRMLGNHLPANNIIVTSKSEVSNVMAKRRIMHYKMCKICAFV